VPEQQKALRRIRQLHADGLSPYKISDDLASRGVKLSHVTVRKIVTARQQA
jgi:transposase-like protein